jgi:hypothetical protein
MVSTDSRRDMETANVAILSGCGETGRHPHFCARLSALGTSIENSAPFSWIVATFLSPQSSLSFSTLTRLKRLLLADSPWLAVDQGAVRP